MKKLIGISFLGLIFCINAYAGTWICKSERFGKFKWDYDDKFIYEVFPNDDTRKYKITKDFRDANISLFGVSKGSVYDYDVYMDFNDRNVKVRQLDRQFGVSGSYYNTECEIFR